MSLARGGIFKFNGQDVTVVGPDIQIGQQAPEFTAFQKDWTTIQPLEASRGKVRILGSLPSFNSSTCDRETRRFNQEAAALSADIAIFLISMDLPWTLRSYCAAASIDGVLTLSDHKEAEFGLKYGVLLSEPRVFRRAVFVVDRQGWVVYAHYTATNGEEPPYEDVLSAAGQALETGVKEDGTW